MQHLARSGLVIALFFVTSSGLAAGEAPTTTGYCDYVQGVAAAKSSLLTFPELFGNFGYLDQSGLLDAPESVPSHLRLMLGVRYRLNGLHEAKLTRRQAAAECRRRKAGDRLPSEKHYRALEAPALAARAQVLTDALSEAEQILAKVSEDLDAHRSTTQELAATRVRVDGLRALAAATTQDRAALPTAVPATSIPAALSALRIADAEVERQEAGLRRAQAWDVSVRAGYDRFITDDRSSPLFAVLSVGFNLGWFTQDRGNRRAAAGRKQMLQQDGELDELLARMRSVLAAEQARTEETSVLSADLEQQIEKLQNFTSEDGRKLRQTVWFEWIKVKAEHAYLVAHIASLKKFLGDHD